MTPPIPHPETPGIPIPLLGAGGRLRVVPVLHGRFEFAVEVRRAFAEHRPHHVVVELPSAVGPRVLEGVRRLPFLSVLRATPRGAPRAVPVFFLVEPGDALVEAVRLGVENDVPVHFADRDSAQVAPVRQSFPDPHAMETIGFDGYTGLCLGAAPEPAGDPEDARRERAMAHRLTVLLRDAEARVLFVCGMSHALPVLERAGAEEAAPFGQPAHLDVELFHLHPDSAREVPSEMAFLQGAYESWRAGQHGPASHAVWPLPRHEILRQLIGEARRRLSDEEGESVSPASVGNLFRYARNVSLLEGALSPDFYTLVLAARGVADDNFAYHVWDVGSTYPDAEAGDRLSLRITLDDLERSGRRVRFRRKIKRARHVMRLVHKRARERRPGEWQENWSGYRICSFPPEDVVIEGYGRFLARKAKGILAADHSRVEPFTTSLLDGIDFRETIRNRLHDGRIYVRRNLPAKGEIGAVIVAFDPEDRDGRYPFRMTWQGEHDQESDMALYSTEPGGQLTGPGISRCEYGGFLLTWPPLRMFGVWEDPDYAGARTPAEHLLAAGIDYSVERMVVYVAPTPPHAAIRSFANRRDRRLLYVPIGQLSPVTLKRIRSFHVLDGHEVRGYARDFIW